MRHGNGLTTRVDRKAGATATGAKKITGSKGSTLTKKELAEIRGSSEFLETFGAWKDYPSAEEMIEVIKSRR